MREGRQWTGAGRPRKLRWPPLDGSPARSAIIIFLRFLTPACRGAACLALLAIGLLGLGGCASRQEASGYLFVKDGAPLQLSNGEEPVVLTQGHATVEFGLKPVFSSELSIIRGATGFHTRVEAQDYFGNSFQVRSSASGLPYDIHASWQENRGERVSRDEYQGCVTSGYCTREVSRLVCPGRKAYREGSNGYADHYDDSACEERVRTEAGHFADCPGEQRLRKAYQVYRYLVSVKFLEPRRPASSKPFAEFTGETRYTERLLEVEYEGPCTVR